MAASLKLLGLALGNVRGRTVRATRKWGEAMNQCAIMSGERFAGHIR